LLHCFVLAGHSLLTQHTERETPVRLKGISDPNAQLLTLVLSLGARPKVTQSLLWYDRRLGYKSVLRRVCEARSLIEPYEVWEDVMMLDCAFQPGKSGSMILRGNNDT
jgi:hypothetical protein